MPHLPLLLHAGASIGWTQWTIHPSTVAGLVLLAVWYEWAAKRMGAGIGEQAAGTPRSPLPAARSLSITRRAAFYTALLVVFVSLNGPLHDLSDGYLFSAHMVQHLLLTLVFPPLLLFGVPGGMVRRLIAPPAVARVARAVTKPVACFVIFNVVLAAWHLPPLYNLALAQHPVHIAQHLMFMAAAVLMWWPLMSPLRELPRLAYPGQMLYCFLMVIPMSLVSIYITMADEVLYPLYATAPRLWGIGPMMDQHLGGLIMWIPGGLFFYGVMTVVFFKWAQRQEDTTAAAQARA